MKIIVSYGGGTNSVAMIAGMKKKGIAPYAILFADTGAEKPHTYAHIEYMNKWLKRENMPTITTIRNEKPSRKGGLENYCLAGNRLPSIAYGFKTCSLMYKKEPFDDWIKSNEITDYVRWIWFDAGESRRAKIFEGTHYPLIEWGWDRKKCIAAIDGAFIKQPGKSACYFCPSSKRQEILQLKKDYPELANRAMALEKQAVTSHVKGLGRDFAWTDLWKFTDAQANLFQESHIDIDCGCYDG